MAIKINADNVSKSEELTAVELKFDIRMDLNHTCNNTGKKCTGNCGCGGHNHKE